MNGVLHNARYAKLRRKVGKIEFIIKKALYVASWHFCTLARFKIIIDEIICREKIIEIPWMALFWISPNAQDVGIATSAMCCQPCLAEVWSNVRQEDVALLIGSCCSRRRQR